MPRAFATSGPQLLAYLVSEITGKPFQHYVNDAILGPLHMGHTYLTEPAVPLAHRVVPFQPSAPTDFNPITPLMPDAPAQLVGESVRLGTISGTAASGCTSTPRATITVFRACAR